MWKWHLNAAQKMTEIKRNYGGRSAAALDLPEKIERDQEVVAFLGHYHCMKITA